MGKPKQQPSHVNLASKMKKQTAYKNYVLSGGSASFSQWQQDNKN